MFDPVTGGGGDGGLLLCGPSPVLFFMDSEESPLVYCTFSHPAQCRASLSASIPYVLPFRGSGKKKKKENLMGFVQILTEEVHLSELTEIKCKVVCIMSCQSAIQRPKASRVLKMTC